MAAPAAFPPRLILEKRALWKQSPLPSLSLLLLGKDILNVDLGEMVSFFSYLHTNGFPFHMN